MEHVVLIMLVLFGGFCAIITFGVMLPLVGQTVASIFIVVMGEQMYAKMKGIESGTLSPEERSS